VIDRCGHGNDERHGTVRPVAGVPGLVALNLAMLALGWSILPVRPRLGRLTLGAGVVGLVGTGYFLSGLGPSGITERIADYPSAAMVVALGVCLLAAAVWRSHGAAATRD
jgi:hypothetical protein